MQALELVRDWPVGRAAVGVVARSGERLGAFGPTDAEFPLASVTKLLSTVATLVAVEEATVSLDDPAGPEGSTIRHLLAHASGLAPDAAKVMSPPAQRRIYSNAGFEALAEVVAHRAAMPFASYLDESVSQPLGLTRTRLEGSPAWAGVSTVDDLLAFAAELMAPTLLAADTLAAATSVVFPGLAGVLPGYGRQDPNDWGLGFELRDHKSPHWTGSRNSPTTFGHFGRSGTFLWVDPGAAVACVGLTDRDFGDWAIDAWPVLADAVLAELR